MGLSVSLRVAGATLADIQTKAVQAVDAFFGETPVTWNLAYCQGDQGVYDENGLPTRYQADIQCSVND